MNIKQVKAHGSNWCVGTTVQYLGNYIISCFFAMATEKTWEISGMTDEQFLDYAKEILWLKDLYPSPPTCTSHSLNSISQYYLSLVCSLWYHWQQAYSGSVHVQYHHSKTDWSFVPRYVNQEQLITPKNAVRTGEHNVLKQFWEPFSGTSW